MTTKSKIEDENLLLHKPETSGKKEKVLQHLTQTDSSLKNCDIKEKSEEDQKSSYKFLSVAVDPSFGPLHATSTNSSPQVGK